MDIWRQLFLLLFSCLTVANGMLRIIDLKVPSTLRNGAHDDVVLDCDFEASADENGLEVKWFYGEDEMIYQWIPNRSLPQAAGSLKERIDLNYRASNDPMTMYRALHIMDVGPDLSGDYKCKITSFDNEDTATKKMIIYEPAKEFEFIHMDEDDKVICTANGVYPEPELLITIFTNNNTATVSNEHADNDDDDDDDEDNNKGAEHKSSNDDDDNVDNDLANVEMNDEPAVEAPGDKNGHADGNDEDDDDDDDDDVDGEDADGDGIDDAEDEFIVVQNDDDTFNLTRVMSYKEAAALGGGDTKIVCELTIPYTTYREKKSIHIYSEDDHPSNATTETQIQSEFDYDNGNNLTAPTRPDDDDSDEEDNSGWHQLPNIAMLLCTFFVVRLTSATH